MVTENISETILLSKILVNFTVCVLLNDSTASQYVVVSVNIYTIHSYFGFHY